MSCKILVIEDNNSKKEAIVAALPFGLKCEPLHAPSIAQAYRAIEGEKWDVIILDMTFLISQGTSLAVEALAGVEILQYLKRRRVSSQVIVATQHSSFSSREMPGIDSIEKLHDILLKAFPKNYREVVRVNTADDAWKSSLRQAVREAYADVLASRSSDRG